jgi:hypothetical protein
MVLMIDALKTIIISVLAFRGLCGSNCKDDDANLLDSLNRFSGHLILLHEMLPVMARKPLMMFLRISMLLSKCRRTWVLQYLLVTWFSLAYVSGSIARQVLCGVSCDACKTCLTSEVLLSANVFIYFRE